MAVRQSKATGGRKKGQKNLVSASAKDNILAVFNRLGGTAAMAKWARANETEFYKLYARLIPVTLSSPPGNPLEILVMPEPELIGKYYERLSQIAADRTVGRAAERMGASPLPKDQNDPGDREG